MRRNLIAVARIDSTRQFCRLSALREGRQQLQIGTSEADRRSRCCRSPKKPHRLPARCRFYRYDSTLLIGSTTTTLTEDVRLCRALLLFPRRNRTRYEMRRSLDEFADPRRVGGSRRSIPIRLPFSRSPSKYHLPRRRSRVLLAEWRREVESFSRGVVNVSTPAPIRLTARMSPPLRVSLCGCRCGRAMSVSLAHLAADSFTSTSEQICFQITFHYKEDRD